MKQYKGRGEKEVFEYHFSPYSQKTLIHLGVHRLGTILDYSWSFPQKRGLSASTSVWISQHLPLYSTAALRKFCYAMGIIYSWIYLHQHRIQLLMSIIAFCVSEVHLHSKNSVKKHVRALWMSRLPLSRLQICKAEWLSKSSGHPQKYNWEEHA